MSTCILCFTDNGTYCDNSVCVNDCLLEFLQPKVDAIFHSPGKDFTEVLQPSDFDLTITCQASYTVAMNKAFATYLLKYMSNFTEGDDNTMTTLTALQIFNTKTYFGNVAEASKRLVDFAVDRDEFLETIAKYEIEIGPIYYATTC